MSIVLGLDEKSFHVQFCDIGLTEVVDSALIRKYPDWARHLPQQSFALLLPGLPDYCTKAILEDIFEDRELIYRWEN